MDTYTPIQWLVSPEGMGHVGCPQCRTAITARQEEGFLNHSLRLDPCATCGKVIDNMTGTILVRRDNAMFLDAETARTATWYHATVRENWIDDLMECERRAQPYPWYVPGETVPMIHVGTRQAAQDRAERLMERDQPNRMYMYTVRLRTDAPMSQYVVDDLPSAPDYAGYCDGKPEYSKMGATRYVNRYESLGSISLLVNTTALEVVSRETMRFPQMASA